MKVFLSYSTKDTAVAKDILSSIEAKGMECFFAPRDIRTGHVYAEEIILNIESSDVLVLLLSNSSNESQHVLREVERAVSNNITVIAYKIEDVKLSPSLEYFLMSNQWLDGENDKGHEMLINDLELLSQELINAPRKTPVLSDSERKSKNKAIINWKYVSIVLLILWLCTLSVLLLNKDKKVEEPEVNLVDSIDEAIEETKISIGDRITFGSYYDEPIEWRVIGIDGDTCTLLSSQVLCMKGFEGAESGTVHRTNDNQTNAADRPFTPTEKYEAFGSNDWEKSSLRAWLNSDSEVVSYSGQIPISKVMCDGDNAYNTEFGFLSGFSKEEKEIMLLSSIKTPYNNPETGSVEIKETSDYVYLLSLEEAKELKSIDISIFTTPTEKAIEHDDSTNYGYYVKVYGIEYSSWWLRTPLEEDYSELYCVFIGRNGEDYTTNVAAVGGMGVRPVIRIDYSKLNIKEPLD